MKKIDNVQEVTDRWQYIMLAVAIFLAIIFCCYYIISQSRWGFYTAGGPVRQQANVLGADESTPSEVDGANDTGEMQTEKDETESDAEPEITKRAYLTFDDGPSGNTVEILDILDKYDVKATFFVVGRDKSYYDAYRDIVDRGHTLGLHSYTHDYDKIYGSLADFSEDIEELRNLLYDVTGVNCVYYDWNALNNDAVCGSYTPEQLVDNIMKDALQHDDVVILMHDLESRHTTVESLPMLIERLRDDGYELLPIDENAPLIRHR